MPLRVVFLDAGGTLLEPDRRFILDQLAAHDADIPDLGRVEQAARARLRSIMVSDDPGNDSDRARAFWQAFVRSAGCPDDAVQDVTAAIMARHAAGRLWTDTLDGAEAVLAGLREAGHTLGVVSNADGRVASFLENAGLAPYLDFVIDSAVVGVEKPDPAIFEIALERAGAEAADAVHVGDIYEIDVVGARAAGVEAILLDRTGDAVDVDCPRIEALTELPGLLAERAPSRARDG